MEVIMKKSEKFAVEIEERKAKERIRKARRKSRPVMQPSKPSRASQSAHKKQRPIIPPKAILRIKKIKTISQIKASGNHVFRLNETSNANPELAHLNKILFGSGNLYADYLEKLGDIKVRKNNVLLVEHLLAVSPEYFQGQDSEAKIKAWEDASLAFLHKEYGDNLVSFCTHHDEISSHGHAHIICRDYAKDDLGKLNARKWFGGKEKLSKLQDRYAEALSPLGIERGLRKSKAKHQDIKTFYSTINSSKNTPTKKLNKIEYEIDSPRVADYINPQAFAEQQVASALKEQKRRLEQQHHSQIRQAAAKAADRDYAVKRAHQYELTCREYESAKEHSDLFRELPLEKVAIVLGLAWDNRKKQFKSKEHIISISGQKFRDFKTNNRSNDGRKLGGGSLDLVMHVKNCSFDDAKSFLAAKFSTEEVAGHVAANTFNIEKNQITPNPLILPQSHPEHLAKAIDHLISDKQLSESLLHQLQKDGTLFTDKNGNAVFLCHDLDGSVTGAEIVQISPNAEVEKVVSVEGSDTSIGAFIAYGEVCDDTSPKITFVDSVIEALSYTELHPREIAISTAGLNTEFINQNLSELLKLSNHNLSCAWPSHNEAEKTYLRMKSTNLLTDRIFPPDKKKSWNKALKAQKTLAQERATELSNNQKETQEYTKHSKWKKQHNYDHTS